MKWTRKIQAFLHDPPDKALKIINHEKRAEEILRAAGIEYARGREDILASAVQRVPVKLNGKEPVVDFYGKSWGNYVWIGYPELKLPVSAERVEYPNLTRLVNELKRSSGYKAIDRLLDEIVEVERRVFVELWKGGYFKLWNSYPEALKNELAKLLRSKRFENADAIAEELVNLPAETRYPDHTIWAHLDLAAALAVEKPVLVRIKVSPVQDFIKNARKEVDLWAGSHMLSYLTFQALKPIIEEFGPDAIVYPHMRGQPFFEREFLGENPAGLEVANIPNKALAIVSEGKFKEIKRKIEESFRRALNDMYDFAVKRAKERVHFDPEKYRYIIEEYFKVTVESAPLYIKFSSYDEIIELLSKYKILDEDRRKWFELLKSLSPHPPQPTELYPVLFEILERATNLESSKFEKGEQTDGWKCRLCGENLAILGDELGYSELMDKWNREPLCPVCLVKRRYRDYLEEKKGYKTAKFESVTDICLRASGWIGRFREDQELRKLHEDFLRVLRESNLANKDGKPCDPDMYYVEYWTADAKRIRERVEEWCEEKKVSEENIRKAAVKVVEILRRAYAKIGEPPRYYAILKLDGDEMGKILSGKKSASVSDFAHGRLKDYFEANVARGLSPSHHLAINQALSKFAVEFVPETVRKHDGDLIYAGGDDVFAILPSDKAFICAKELADYFSSARLFIPWHENGKSGLTMSGGLLIVHYKHPLYDAVDLVIKLEKKAKNLGRNALAVGYLTRSGSYREVVLSWEAISEVNELVELLKKSKRNEKPCLSERIIYHVVEEVENLPNDVNAVESFLRYEISRHYSEKNSEKVDLLVSSVINASKKVRVELVKGDFESFELEDRPEKIVSEINRTIASGKQLSGVGIKGDLNEIRGIILKKQVKGLFLLLKILLDCGADLRGADHEGDNRA